MNRVIMAKLTTEEFIKEAREVHGDILSIFGVLQ